MDNQVYSNLYEALNITFLYLKCSLFQYFPLFNNYRLFKAEVTFLLSYIVVYVLVMVN